MTETSKGPEPRRHAGLSVAISTRDRPEALARCLEALRRCRTLPAEVVVADQSTGPATREVVSAHTSPDLPIHWVPGGTRGLAEAQNAAFRQVKMPLVAVTDDDCIPAPDWVTIIESEFASDPRLALVGGRVTPLEPAGMNRFPVALRGGMERRAFEGRSAPWNVGSGNNFAIRREWFARVGGCDERLGPGTPGLGALDMDLFYRVLRAGGRALYVPDAVVEHERTTRRGRLERRWTYGHGMGAACALRLREGDLFGAKLLGDWVLLRIRLLGASLARGQAGGLREEALVLGGTFSGIVHGARQPAGRPTHPDWRRGARDDENRADVGP